jgi:hypothetical protein
MLQMTFNLIWCILKSTPWISDDDKINDCSWFKHVTQKRKTIISWARVKSFLHILVSTRLINLSQNNQTNISRSHFAILILSKIKLYFGCLISWSRTYWISVTFDKSANIWKLFIDKCECYEKGLYHCCLISSLIIFFPISWLKVTKMLESNVQSVCTHCRYKVGTDTQTHTQTRERGREREMSFPIRKGSEYPCATI